MHPIKNQIHGGMDHSQIDIMLNNLEVPSHLDHIILDLEFSTFDGLRGWQHA